MSEALDIIYPSGFYSYQAPVHLDYIAAINGLPPPVDQGEPFTYLDLGCGDGFTIALLAAAYPQSRFVGVDLNPGHIAAGETLRAKGELTNLRLVEGGFEAWRDLDLPECDYIGMHGVYAWISAAAREAVVALAADRLKPGGLLYAGYNCWPGWAAMAPLRQFMIDLTRGAPGDPVEAVAAALAQLRALRGKGAQYFVQNPAAAGILDEMAGKDVRYVAHEIYSPHWAPLPFSTVAGQMRRAGLAYAGSADLQHNYARPSVSAEFTPLLLREADRERAELYRDLANNTFFRRDVFVKGAASRPTPAEVTRRLETLLFGSRVPSAELRRAIPLPGGEMPLDAPIFEALRRGVAEGAAHPAELRALPGLAGQSPEAVAQALQLLALGNQIVAFATRPQPVSEAPRDWTIPLPLNRHLLAEPLAGSPAVLPIAPALGIPAPVSRDEALMLLAVAEAGRESAADWALDYAAARGTPARDAAAHRTAFVRLLAESAPRLRKLAELGVITPR